MAYGTQNKQEAVLIECSGREGGTSEMAAQHSTEAMNKKGGERENDEEDENEEELMSF